MTTLILIGDSWGCGEWHHPGHNQIEISHPGLNEYLAQDFRLVNLSRPGASNWQICSTLFNYLTHKLPMMDEDFRIVLIQTDASRDTMAAKFDVDYNDLIKECDSLADLYTKLIDIFYIKCQNFAQQFNVKLYMCGGLSDLDLATISLYNSLIPLCPSWVNLIDPQHNPSVIPLRMSPELFVSAKHNGRLDLCEEIIAYSDQQFLKLQHMLESEYFGPGLGDYHPSRFGHELLGNFIKAHLENPL